MSPVLASGSRKINEVQLTVNSFGEQSITLAFALLKASFEKLKLSKFILVIFVEKYSRLVQT